MHESREMIVRFEDISARERAQVTETYLCIREHEENRARNKTTEEYPDPYWSERREELHIIQGFGQWIHLSADMKERILWKKEAGALHLPL